MIPGREARPLRRPVHRHRILHRLHPVGIRNIRIPRRPSHPPHSRRRDRRHAPVFIVLGFGAGVYTAGRVAEAEGNRLNRSAALAKAMFQPAGHAQPDPSIVVIDEIVGMWISLAGVGTGPLPFITAFVLFRLFDVLKPEPARSLERLPRGWGSCLTMSWPGCTRMPGRGLSCFSGRCS